MTDMGTFRVMIEVENPLAPGVRRAIPAVLVDAGAELSWFPAQVLEDLGIWTTQGQSSAQPPASAPILND